MQQSGEKKESHLLQMLGSALQLQDEKWTPAVYNQPVNKDVEVSPEQRNDIVRWLVTLKPRFDLGSWGTVALAVSIMDKFLHSVKVRPKYLRCIGITCFYLAAKTCEDDEDIPSTSELVEESECGRTVSEVLRMELVILDKLGWDLNLPTPLHFIQIFHALVGFKMPHLLNRRGRPPSRQLSGLAMLMNRCIEHHAVTSVKPSTLACALYSLELESQGADWFTPTIWLQDLIKCNNDSLIHCREQLSRHMFAPSFLPPRFRVMTPGSGAIKRKVEQMEVDDNDDDDIYDGIKRLYGEEVETVVPPAVPCAPSCGREFQRPGMMTPPGLTAAAN